MIVDPGWISRMAGHAMIGSKDPATHDWSVVGERGKEQSIDRGKEGHWVSLPQIFLIVLVGVMFSGAERFLFTFSPVLHYGFDLTLIVLILLSLVRNKGILRNAIAALWPYLLWVVL